MTMCDVYVSHNVGRRYIKKNYKDVLTKLEQEGRIIADPPAGKRRRGTFAGGVRVTFPPRGT
jgi:hypothetical protein